MFTSGCDCSVDVVTFDRSFNGVCLTRFMCIRFVLIEQYFYWGIVYHKRIIHLDEKIVHLDEKIIHLDEMFIHVDPW